MATTNELKTPKRLLGQVRPAVTSAVAAWTVPYFGQYNIHLINAVNLSTSLSITISIYHDPTGVSYTDDSALVEEYTLGPGDVFQYEARGGITDYRFGGSIGVKVSSANQVNFMIYGSLEGEKVQPT